MPPPVLGWPRPTELCDGGRALGPQPKAGVRRDKGSLDHGGGGACSWVPGAAGRSARGQGRSHRGQPSQGSAFSPGPPAHACRKPDHATDCTTGNALSPLKRKAGQRKAGGARGVGRGLRWRGSARRCGAEAARLARPGAGRPLVRTLSGLNKQARASRAPAAAAMLVAGQVAAPSPGCAAGPALLQPRGREPLHAPALRQAGRQHRLQPRGLRCSV